MNLVLKDYLNQNLESTRRLYILINLFFELSKFSLKFFKYLLSHALK